MAEVIVTALNLEHIQADSVDPAMPLFGQANPGLGTRFHRRARDRARDPAEVRRRAQGRRRLGDPRVRLPARAHAAGRGAPRGLKARSASAPTDQTIPFFARIAARTRAPVACSFVASSVLIHVAVMRKTPLTGIAGTGRARVRAVLHRRSSSCAGVPGWRSRPRARPPWWLVESGGGRAAAVSALGR